MIRGGLVAAAVLPLVACGAHGPAKRDLTGCLILEDNAYAAQVVARAYEEGKLGTQAQVEREIDRRSLPGDGKTLFDKDGHMIPYLKLSSHQQGWLTDWIFQTDVSEITHVRDKIAKHEQETTKQCESES